MKLRVAALGLITSLLVAAAFCRSGQAQQQSPPEGGDSPTVEGLSLSDALDVSISIASGKTQPIEEAPGIVSVYTDEDIRRLGVHTLEELLKVVPGFDVLVDGSGRDRINIR